ncbi:hypothetical protein [Vibrio caribbeanicus]|uniref:Uncharacterized protein n=1 Tax=Vibrio caribbeanicus ATCC BAA-2122 TaxID=796620 RepID=E3BKZ2_9VIBR|nr:hypothetical protein [Vibrio caribbeanicus]EFP96336.1 hypothetical protein VIBC2010_12244 [Vibrio caribbeanicus ATCC BAA-2122]
MSSSLSSIAWAFKATKPEDKLLILALAEIADNKGNFETSIEELHQLTGLDSGIISSVLRHFLSPMVALINLTPREDKSKELFCGKLMLQQQTSHSLNDIEQINLLAQVQEQHNRIESNKRNNRGKLNRAQRAQVAPLDPSAQQKQYNVLEIHMEQVPDWAEAIMFQKGVLGRKEIWDSLVVDVHQSGERLFSLKQLTNRLHQKIDYFKDLSFKSSKSSGSQRTVRQSALSEFEEKASNYLSRYED